MTYKEATEQNYLRWHYGLSTREEYERTQKIIDRIEKEAPWKHKPGRLHSLMNN